MHSRPARSSTLSGKFYYILGIAGWRVNFWELHGIVSLLWGVFWTLLQVFLSLVRISKYIWTSVPLDLWMLNYLIRALLFLGGCKWVVLIISAPLISLREFWEDCKLSVSCEGSRKMLRSCTNLCKLRFPDPLTSAGVGPAVNFL